MTPSPSVQPKDSPLRVAAPLRPRTTGMDELAKRVGSSPRFSLNDAAAAVAHAVDATKAKSKV